MLPIPILQAQELISLVLRSLTSPRDVYSSYASIISKKVDLSNTNNLNFYKNISKKIDVL
ncbi:hypothetical protein PCC6912_40420 [Chlorogloeopsis fritschii PCC 6912]|uniref:Uncharacterized protein n=1 Tax=Chlorogloeopsis fritschii PCC 6912 TaxID=211165 RepID=A0A3S0Y5M9_CHLFR|nr:hypothetical protein PCC6912_40420 [Chlorogloeopsis fritschii PCC 6912]